MSRIIRELKIFTVGGNDSLMIVKLILNRIRYVAKRHIQGPAIVFYDSFMNKK